MHEYRQVAKATYINGKKPAQPVNIKRGQGKKTYMNPKNRAIDRSGLTCLQHTDMILSIRNHGATKLQSSIDKREHENEKKAMIYAVFTRLPPL